MAFGIFSSLTGSEILQVTGITASGLPSGQSGQCTTGQIAALAALESTADINTVISTVGAGTLTAAAIVGKNITRTGSTSAFTDTTATAAQIIAALPSGAPIGTSFKVTILNATAGTQTIAGGTGVTVSGYSTIPAASTAQFLVTYSAANTVTIFGNLIAFLPIDSPGVLTTVGAGTITGALFQTSFVSRSGPVAAFTDTTDTAANIILQSGISPGVSQFFIYKNTTAFNATLAAGSGVTITGGTIVPANSTMFGLYTETAPGAVTLTVYFVSGNAVFNTATTALTTVGAGTITAVNIVNGATLRSGSTTAFTDTTDTAANIISAFPNAAIGESFEYTYVNNTVAAATIAAGSGVTLSGVTAVPANSWATYLVTYSAAGAVVMVGISQGFFPHSGTFANNGTSTVTTSDANVTAGSNILITLKTVGGTVGAIPHLLTITPGTGFATVGTASDTSTYNYTILG